MELIDLSSQGSHFLVIVFMVMLVPCVTSHSTNSDVCVEGMMCPSPCECSADNTRVDCGKTQLVRLPSHLPLQTKTLLFDGNKLASLPDRALSGCGALLHLDISSNNLTCIKKFAFTGVDQLNTLLLNNNSIDFNLVLTSVFRNLTQLSKLSIHDNTPTKVGTYNDKLFEDLTGLKNLTMDGLSNTTFGPGFSQLRDLEYLNLCGNLQYITNDTLQAFNSSAIKTFMVRSGVLVDVDELAFAHFSHLETLDLSFNPHLGFPNMSKSWFGLQYTTISSLILESSAPYHWQIVTIERSFFKYLELTKLKKLVLDGNNIVTVEAVFSFHTRHLEHLSMAHNMLIQVLGLMIDLFFLPSLSVVDMSYQSKRVGLNALRKWPSAPGDNVLPQKSVSSSGHKILSWKEADVYLPYILSNRTALEQLHDTGYVLIEGVGFISRTLPLPVKELHILLPPSLRSYNGAACSTMAYVTMPNVTFYGPSELEMIVYSQNNMQRMVGPIVFLNNAKRRFVLDENRCSFLDPNFARNCSDAIEAMLLGNNLLGPQLGSDENSRTMEQFPEITTLDLSYNNIKNLPKNIFIHQAKLQQLNLSHNSLRLIEFRFDHMADLAFMDLSANLLDQLDLATRTSLRLVASRTNLTVDLKNNPLKCSCDSVPFLEWVLEERVRLVDWEKYECIYKGKLVGLSMLKTSVLPDLRIACHSKTWVVASATCLVTIVVVIGASFALYRHRFEIRYLCLKLVINRRRYENLVEEEVAYEYDAFVAFDQNDITWVNEELIPNVDSSDGEGDFKLLVHHRDFIPGTRIEENILRGIQKSRKVMLVLSRHFVESNWCDFELQMARMRCFEEGKELLVPILLEEDVVTMNMSRTLRSLLNRNCYIKWPENPAEIENFWINLKKALAANPDRIITCQCGRTMNM